jgi:hypothetical protein
MLTNEQKYQAVQNELKPLQMGKAEWQEFIAYIDKHYPEHEIDTYVGGGLYTVQRELDSARGEGE